jgi:hypothetical protein
MRRVHKASSLRILDRALTVPQWLAHMRRVHKASSLRILDRALTVPRTFTSGRVHSKYELDVLVRRRPCAGWILEMLLQQLGEAAVRFV